MDYLLRVTNLVVAIATGILAIYAVIQARATQKAADAALFNAQAVVNSERPWIVVTVEPHPTISGNFIFRATNKGRTPAEFVSGSATHVYVDIVEELRVPPNYSSPFERPRDALVIQSDNFEIYSPAGVRPEEIEKNFWFDERNKILNTNHILIFYGRIVYDDVFGKGRPGYTSHETRWCLACHEIGKRFITTGPDEYNRNS